MASNALETLFPPEKLLFFVKEIDVILQIEKF